LSLPLTNMTRKQGYRNLLACLFYASNPALAYWLVPSKHKGPRTETGVLWKRIVEYQKPYVLKMLQQSFYFNSLLSRTRPGTF
jgi:hypothetical protein